MSVKDVNGGMIAVLGLSTVEIIKLWQSVAPSLEEVRNAEPDDIAIHQRMQDANYLGAGLAALIGGTTSVLLQSWLPIIMALGSVVLFSYWHLMVLRSDDIESLKTRG